MLRVVVLEEVLRGEAVCLEEMRLIRNNERLRNDTHSEEATH